MSHVPFNCPSLSGREIEYVRQAIRNGHLAGDGPFTRRCHDLLQTVLGIPKALLTTSCTHALEMAALLLDVGPGDEIIVPSFTFPSTANAFVLRGASPVFIDVRPDTLNMDEVQLERLITPRTRAIVPVHYAGVGCEMDAIGEIAARHGVPVVEDNAHGLFARYRGRYLGTFGCLATQSFHESKNFTCGEGGALLVNEPSFIERAEILREKGTDRSRFFRGEIDRYSWVDLGSSYLLSDVLAAFLFAQLEDRDVIQDRRKRRWDAYRDGLAGWAAERGVRLPTVPSHCEPSHHLFHLILPTPADRQAMIAHLGRHGVTAYFHYVPLHRSEFGEKLGGRPGQCPVTEWAGDRLLRLPLHNDLTEDDQQTVIDAIGKFSGWSE